MPLEYVGFLLSVGWLFSVGYVFTINEWTHGEQKSVAFVISLLFMTCLTICHDNITYVARKAKRQAARTQELLKFRKMHPSVQAFETTRKRQR